MDIYNLSILRKSKYLNYLWEIVTFVINVSGLPYMKLKRKSYTYYLNNWINIISITEKVNFKDASSLKVRTLSKISSKFL